MRKKLFTTLASILILGTLTSCLPVKAQWTPYGLGLMQRPNAYTARIYLGITNVVAGTNIVIYYSPSLGSLIINSTGSGGGGGAGTVTSFSSGDLSPLFTTSVATASTTPALSFSLSSQSANTFFAGPSSGVAAAPTFRLLVPDDIPTITLSKISDAGTVAAINLNGNAGEYLDGQGNFVPVSTAGNFVENVSGVVTNLDIWWDVGTSTGLRIFNQSTGTQVMGSSNPGGPPLLWFPNIAINDSIIVSTTGDPVGAYADGSIWIRTDATDVTNFLWGSILGNWVPLSSPSSGSSGGISGVTNSGGVHSLIAVSNPPAIGLKSISAGSNVTVTDQGTNLVLSASGGGGGSLSAGIGTRDVTVDDTGALYAGNIFADNTVFTIDEEFLGGSTTSGSVGTHGWRIQTGSIAGTASPWGSIRNASIVTRAALQVASLAGGSPLPALGSITNYQIMARFKLGATNATSLIRVGVTGADITAGNNWVMVSLSAATNAEFFNFQCNSSGSSDWALSSVAAVTNQWYTWRAWTTNQTDIYMAINNETPVVFTNGASMTANTPWFETAGLASVLEMDRYTFRASNIDRY